MTPRSFLLTPELGDYVRASSEPPDDVVTELLAETAAMGDRGEAPPTYQIPPEQGAFMQLLTRALGVRRAIEIGTFTGFSALCVARGRGGGGGRWGWARPRVPPPSGGPGGARRGAGWSPPPAGRGGGRPPAGTGSAPAWPTGSSCASATPTSRCVPSPRNRRSTWP